MAGRANPQTVHCGGHTHSVKALKQAVQLRVGKLAASGVRSDGLARSWGGRGGLSCSNGACTLVAAAAAAAAAASSAAW